MRYLLIGLAVAAGLFIVYTVAGTVFGTLAAVIRNPEDKKGGKDEKWPVLENKATDSKFRQMKNKGLEWLGKRDFEELTLKTYDGLTLKGKFYRTENAKATVILIHGFRSWPERDFCTVFDYFGENGFNILIYDRRGHGESEGRYITYGVLDRYDLRDWTYYIDELCEKKYPIIWDGISMGGATVAMASSLELPDNLRAVICDCPYTTAKEEIVYAMKHYYHLPAFPLIYTVDTVTRIIAKYGFTDCDARKEVAKTRIPFFFAHGEADDFVPCYMGRQIYEACSSDKVLFTVPGATHGFSYVVATEEYQRKLAEFFKKNHVFQ